MKMEFVCEKREGVRQSGVAGVREFKKEKTSTCERCHSDISVESLLFLALLSLLFTSPAYLQYHSCSLLKKQQ